MKTRHPSFFFYALIFLCNFSLASEDLFPDKTLPDLNCFAFESISATNACFEIMFKERGNPSDVEIYEVNDKMESISEERRFEKEIPIERTTIYIPMFRKILIHYIRGGAVLGIYPKYHDKKRGVVSFDFVLNTGWSPEILDPRWELYGFRRTWTKEFTEEQVFGADLQKKQESK